MIMFMVMYALIAVICIALGLVVLKREVSRGERIEDDAVSDLVIFSIFWIIWIPLKISLGIFMIIVSTLNSFVHSK